MRNGPARLLRVSFAAPVSGRLGAVEVTEGRVLPPPCEYRREAWRPDMRREPAGWLSLARREDSVSPRNNSRLAREPPSGALTSGRHWSITPVVPARRQRHGRGSAVYRWTCRCSAGPAEDRGSEGVDAPQHWACRFPAGPEEDGGAQKKSSIVGAGSAELVAFPPPRLYRRRTRLGRRRVVRSSCRGAA